MSVPTPNVGVTINCTCNDSCFKFCPRSLKSGCCDTVEIHTEDQSDEIVIHHRRRGSTEEHSTEEKVDIVVDQNLNRRCKIL